MISRINLIWTDQAAIFHFQKCQRCNMAVYPYKLSPLKKLSVWNAKGDTRPRKPKVISQGGFIFTVPFSLLQDTGINDFLPTPQKRWFKSSVLTLTLFAGDPFSRAR